MKKLNFLFILLGINILVACTSGSSGSTTPTPTPAPINPPQPVASVLTVGTAAPISVLSNNSGEIALPIYNTNSTPVTLGTTLNAPTGTTLDWGTCQANQILNTGDSCSLKITYQGTTPNGAQLKYGSLSLANSTQATVQIPISYETLPSSYTHVFLAQSLTPIVLSGNSAYTSLWLYNAESTTMTFNSNQAFTINNTSGNGYWSKVDTNCNAQQGLASNSGCYVTYKYSDKISSISKQQLGYVPPIATAKIIANITNRDVYTNISINNDPADPAAIVSLPQLITLSGESTEVQIINSGDLPITQLSASVINGTGISIDYSNCTSELAIAPGNDVCSIILHATNPSGNPILVVNYSDTLASYQESSTINYSELVAIPNFWDVDTEVGTPVTQNITLSNNGQASLLYSGYTMSESLASLTINDSNCIGKSLGSCTVSITYLPTTVQNGELVVSFNAGNTTLPFPINYDSHQAPVPIESTVRGWPEYIAQGGITMDYNIVENAIAEYNNRPVNAIFAYSNGEGSSTLVAPSITRAIILAAQAISSNNDFYTRPVIVHYTLNQSEGINPAPLGATEMAKHFTKLIYNIQMLEYYYDATTNPYPGSFVMNPDTLGEIQKENGTATGQPFAGTFAVNDAIHTAVCATSNNFNWNISFEKWSGGPVFTYQANTNALTAYAEMVEQSGAAWASKLAWDDYFANTIYPQCNSTSPITSGVNIPTFANDFKGWIQATNWIFKQFGPHTTFGWQENVWVISPGGTWVHDHSLSEAQVQTQYANPVYTWLNNEGVFNGTYRPDFIVFDKYERDDYQVEANTFANGWLWNEADFTNYLRYVKDVTANIGKDQTSQSYHAMLWQVPGGHLQYTTDTTLQNIHASTEPVMVFGDNTLTTNFGNVKPVLLGTSGSTYATLPNSYSLSGYQGQTPLNFFLSGGTVTPWQNSRMNEVADAHVFSILWGGGNTTSVGTKPWDDPWLSNKLIEYYTNTTPVR